MDAGVEDAEPSFFFGWGLTGLNRPAPPGLAAMERETSESGRERDKSGM